MFFANSVELVFFHVSIELERRGFMVLEIEFYEKTFLIILLIRELNLLRELKKDDEYNEIDFNLIENVMTELLKKLKV